MNIIAKDENYGPEGLVSYIEFYDDGTAKEFIIGKKAYVKREQSEDEKDRCSEYVDLKENPPEPIKERIEKIDAF